MKPIHLSVIIPCYNESRNLRLGALTQVAYFLEKKHYTWEVIIVDDGSTDHSRDQIRTFLHNKPRFKLYEERHQGKAATIITGMTKASGEVILFTDLDQATPIREMDKLLPWVDKGYDVVIGSRNTRREGSPFLRYLMARGFMLLREMILGLHGITDTQCGFKAFTQESVKAVLQKIKLYKGAKNTTGPAVTAGFDVELLFIAQQSGYKIKEVPVEWYYVESRRISPLKDSISGIVDLVAIKINSLKGDYR